jgi:hypothetical protein
MSRRLLVVLAAIVCGVSPALAQEAPPPHLSVLDGRAEVARGTDREAAIANTPLAIGDRLQTDAGRAEVLLGDGSAIHLDDRTTIDVNGDTVLRLIEGRIIVLAERGAAGALQIDAAPASVIVQSSAEVHLALVGDGTLQVAVVRGLVDVDAGTGRVSVRAGQQVFVREGEAPSYPAPFNSARADGFVRWSQALLDSRRGSSSAQYLPAEVRVYGSTFDTYGSWSYAAPYGYVWYPRVARTWRPYHHGRWRHGARFGWTFVGYDPWGWATHHYGRWGITSAGAWFWIPSSGWGAAWVQWAVAPGYVGWCPLGWNNRPVFGFWGHGGPRRAGPYYGDPWNAWSVIPTHAFRTGVPVHRERFDPRLVTGPRAPQFVVQPTPPNVAVPRGAIVPPSSRVAGPSVTPGGMTSRRGQPAAPSGGAYAVPRGSAASAAPAVPGTGRGRDAAAPAVRTAPPAARTGAVPRTSPPVIYHRGTPIDPRQQQSGASPYGRAGVPVPGDLPADADTARRRSPYGDPGTRAGSPYDGRAASPYDRGRSQAPGVMRGPSRSGDHPDYAVPRGQAPREAPTNAPPAYAPRSAPPRSYDAPRVQDAPRPSAPPPSYAPRGSGGDRAVPRSGPPPRSNAAPPPSRGQGAARSGGDRGSSGTATPRRR